MKRITAIVCAALLLAALAFGCGGDPAAVQLPEPSDDYGWMTQTESTTEPAETTGEEETLPEGVYTSIVYLTSAPTTKAGDTTAKTPVLSGSASATAKTSSSAATAKTTAKTTTKTTTKTTSTARGTTKHYANGINITSKNDALSKFNAAIKKALDSKAGFAKSHMITYKDWAFDPALLEGVPNVGGLFDPDAFLSNQLNAALGKGVRSATVYKGDGTNLLKTSGFTMDDLKDVTYTGSQGGEWTVTVLVKDGETRQEKRLLGSRATGSSPIDKGPLHMATGDGNLYDHMDADRIFSLVQNTFSFINAEPIDISESTSQVKFVARIDGEGKLLELKDTYNQTINLHEIRILNGADAYKDNTGSSTVTVTFDAFAY